MRIVTRSDFDSLISAVMLSTVYEIDDALITRPDSIINNEIEITKNDIIANLPYNEKCGLWFDHHVNEKEMAAKLDFEGHFKAAPSCSRTVFDHFQHLAEIPRFAALVNIADKFDSAQFSTEEIQNPQGWLIIERTLHAFDPKGRLGDFKVYFLKLMDWIKSRSLSEILLSDDVQKRIEFVRSEHKLFINALNECSYTDQNVIITDSRKMRYFPNGNRFVIYTLFPHQNVSVSIFNKRDTHYSVIFCGHNIFNRTCKTDINNMLQKYNGSGRYSAGTCIVHRDEADSVLKNIIAELKSDN